MDDLLFFGGAATFMLVVLAVIVSLSMAIVSWVGRYECRKFSEQTQIRTEYHFWGSGCLLELDDKKIPYDKWVNNTGN